MSDRSYRRRSLSPKSRRNTELERCPYCRRFFSKYGYNGVRYNECYTCFLDKKDGKILRKIDDAESEVKSNDNKSKTHVNGDLESPKEVAAGDHDGGVSPKDS